MAKVKSEIKQGWGKLLEAWEAPEGVGDPIGCVATSFTFSPALFEEHCLARFLKLESTLEEDGAVHLVEREEKLAQSYCAAIVDQHHCSGSRSLRWDLLPARVPNGILHAKISLLHWAGMVRLIVGSANLTEDGYRRNQEVFGVLDYREGGEAPLVCLRQIVEYLRDLAESGEVGDAKSSRAVLRLDDFLGRILRVAGEWGNDDEAQQRAEIGVWPVLVGLSRPNALDSLAERWPGPSPANQVAVVSPFFDPPEAENKPARRIWDLLRKRGEASVEYMLEVEEIEGEEKVFVRAPESIVKAQPIGRTGISTQLFKVPIEDGRPLHAKQLWVGDGRWCLSMMGSSNFTSAGLGLGRNVNLEANLVYRVDGKSNSAAQKAVEKAFLWGGEPLSLDAVKWKPVPAEGKDDPGKEVPLDPAFGEAQFGKSEKGAVVGLTFAGIPPAGWALFLESDDTIVFYDEAAWMKVGKHPAVMVPWHGTRPPSGFVVRWRGLGGPAWWPVNVTEASALPPPEELRDLSLEVLISVLTSAKPLHVAFRRHLGRAKQAFSEKGIVDPHDKVDTSKFLLRRTRRVSELLRALRERLGRPVATESGLEWRMNGPVGVTAVAAAIAREALSDGERAFLLSELLLEISRVKPQAGAGSLPGKKVRDGLRAVAAEVRAMIPPLDGVKEANLRSYLAEALERSGQ